MIRSGATCPCRCRPQPLDGVVGGQLRRLLPQIAGRIRRCMLHDRRAWRGGSALRPCSPAEKRPAPSTFGNDREPYREAAAAVEAKGPARHSALDDKTGFDKWEVTD